LPLFLDETLGNSDESRAELVIGTLLQLAAAGRQLFYVTAQADEVQKWRALLADHAEVESAFFDLAAIRELQLFERAPLSYSAADGFRPAPLPVPAGMTRGEYGELLKVPALDPFSPVESLHLWYVIDKPELVHQLLSGYLRTWGHLRAQVESVGSLLLSEDEYRRAEAHSRAIEAACRLWRNGRGRPVDSDTIAAAGVVSSTFLEQVCQLAGECAGNAALLIGKLEAGAVPRFQTKTIAKLRSYLEENGFLDNRPILSHEEMLRQMCAAASVDISQGLIEPDALVWILNVLPRGNFGEVTVIPLVLTLE